MTQINLGGPGLGLPFPQPLYPNGLLGAATQPAANAVGLAAGDALPIPPGKWMVQVGAYLFLQFLDPVSGGWYNYSEPAPSNAYQIQSDGQNFRLANLTGCPIGAVVTATGSSYVQASTSISASAGGSTWQPIVGGAISTSPSIVAAGSGYTVPPLVIIPAPPSPGLQATAHATLTSGSVTSVTVDNQGAGYAGATITFSVLPSPYDPNYGSITNATVTAVTTGAGSLVAAVCTNNGAPQASAPTLTVSGVGSGASATAVMCWTATGASVTAAGATYGTLTPWVTTIGGLSAASPSWTNPRYEVSIMRPRPASMAAAVASGSITSIATVYDGGLFTGTPTTLVLADAAPTVAAVLAVTLGNTYDVATLQPI